MTYRYPCKCKPKSRSRYRRLNADELPGAITLYCLDCRGQWKSKTKYAAGLELHTPAKRERLCDECILEMVIDGTIQVTPMTAEVLKAGRELKIIERQHRDGEQRGTYRFIYACKGSARKKIARHRLVWMAWSGAMIPEGYDVDHIFGSEWGDEVWNLRLLPSDENRRLGAAKARENSLQDEVLF